MNTDLGVTPGDNRRFFVTGQKAQGQLPSKFIKTNLGKDQMYNTPKYIAQRLDKPDWNSYTSHTMRRSSATRAADSGAQDQDLLRLVSMIPYHSEITIF